jgi:hypothetical protein
MVTPKHYPVDVSVANQRASATDLVIGQIQRNHCAAGADAGETKYVRLQSG